MPIDARIPLGVRQAPPANPFGDLGEILKLKQMQALLPVQLQSAQQEQLLRAEQLKAAQRTNQEADAVKAAVGAAGGDVEKALPGVMQANPTAGMGLAKALAEMDDAKLKRANTALTLDKAKTEFAAQIIGDVKDEASYQEGLQLLKQSGLDISKLAPNFRPDAVDQYRQRGLDVKQKLDAAHTELLSEIARRKEAREKQEFAAKLPGIEADTATKIAESQGQKPIQPVDRARLAFGQRQLQRQEAAAAEAMRHNLTSEGIQAARLQKSIAGRPVTSGDAGRIADYDTSLDDLKALDTVLTETKGATGTGAAIGAALPAWVTDLTGAGTDAKKRQGVIDRVKQVIGKTLEGGVLRKEDELKYEKILPTIKDTAAVAASKIAGLEKAIRLRRETQVEALADAGYDTSRYAARAPHGAEVPKVVRARDPQGKLHEAPAGTALPAGWKLEP